MGSREIIDTLIQGYQHRDPRLYDILMMLSGQIKSTEKRLIDLVNTLTPDQVADLFTLDPPLSFTYSLPGTTLVFSWSAVTDARYYELRKGTDWDTATFITRTSSLTATLGPILVGTHTYLIKSIDQDGAYSASYTSVTVLIPEIQSVSITSTKIDNTVLLYWTVPSAPFGIHHYNIYRGSILVGTAPGTFTTIFETSAGTYVYGIRAYDSVGNYSELSTLEVEVQAPPDYDLVAQEQSTLTGTLTNALVEGSYLLAPVVSETFEDHFIDSSWSTIQDQIDAGYPIYIQPAAASAGYEETFDIGLIYTNVIINIFWSSILVTADDVAVQCEIAYSDDDITYSAYEVGLSAYAESLRYVKVKLTFTPATDKALIKLSDLKASLDIKYGTDSGDVEADSTDVSGTFVAFNKAFRDVNSITLTCLDTVPIYVVYDFTDVPDPAGFYVYAFNSSGTRVTKTVSWKARGII